MRASSALGLVACLVGRVSASVAAEPPPSEAPRDRWYGQQTLAVDAAALAVGVGAYAASSSWRRSVADPPSLTAYIATSLYGGGLVGAPIVHWANGRTGVGFADLGVRLTLPPIVGLTGILVNCTAQEFHDCAQDGMIGGTLVGSVAVIAIDALAFTRVRSPATPPSATRWYGWQTLAVDAALLGAGAYFASRPRDPVEPGKHEYSDLLYLGLGWYAFSSVTAPIVHFAHGRVGIGFADFGVRIGLPLVSVVPGLIVACSGLGGRDGCTYAGIEGGILGGMILASGLDAFVFAREKVAGPPSKAGTLLPLLAPQPGGAIVGAMGSF